MIKSCSKAQEEVCLSPRLKIIGSLIDTYLLIDYSCSGESYRDGRCQISSMCEVIAIRE